MSEDSETDETDPEPEVADDAESEEPWSIDAEWAWVQREAGLEGADREYFVSPILLLYAGFFFGPFSTVLLTPLILRGRTHLRTAAFIFGTAGAIWCLILGLSIVYAPKWSEFELQFLRSGLNFLNGVAAFVIVRREGERHFSHGRGSLIRSGVAIIVFGVIFFALPATVLVNFGR